MLTTRNRIALLAVAALVLPALSGAQDQDRRWTAAVWGTVGMGQMFRFDDEDSVPRSTLALRLPSHTSRGFWSRLVPSVCSVSSRRPRPVAWCTTRARAPREFPEDTFVQFVYLPTLRALFVLSAHDAPAATQALQIASRYDLALGGVGFIGHFGSLYPIYVRGLAHLAAERPADAAAEFQRIVDHRSIVLFDPLDALARLQLARALALAGDTAKAKSVYRDLLDLWEDADTDLPTLLKAKAEYARLPD